MRSLHCTVGVLLVMFATAALGAPNVTISPPQKKELKAIATDAGKISSMISKKKFSDASTAIGDVEERLSKFSEETGLKETDSNIKPIKTQIEKLKKQLNAATEKASATFEKTVASILAQKCVECHGEDPKGGLRLDTFEGLEKGGKSGFLIAPGDPTASAILQRLLTSEETLRMPYGKEPLSEFEIQSIANWIESGANFEGDKTASMASLAKSTPVSKSPPASKTTGFSKPTGFGKSPAKTEITKESGKETVHFMKDVMPELVDTCGRCHNDKDKRSGFSVMSFEKLMKGGDSGVVITPGKPDSSRLWRLVNGDDTPIMPMGNQTGITRKWHANLRTWIEEGAKFDGADPKKPFPTLQERETAALAKFTPEQWLTRRKQASDADWKKTFPMAEPQKRESAEFLLYGDVSPERLEQVEKWASEEAAAIRQSFKLKDPTIWRGKLAIFVMKDRFGYEEFNNSVHRREVPREVVGHVQVTALMEEAFVAVQDLGDAISETSPGMRVNVQQNVASAYFKRNGRLPDWLTVGAGLAMAHQKSSGNQFLNALPRAASSILQDSNLADPNKVFEDGTFSPGDIVPVGYALVQFLLTQSSLQQLDQLALKIQGGTSVDAALVAIYRTDSRSLAMAFVQSLPAPGMKGKK